jgi:hypothetical protein
MEKPEENCQSDAAIAARGNKALWGARFVMSRWSIVIC